MKPCFGYIRVSTQKQGLGVSLEAQKEAIKSFASQHNLTVTQWFEEKETAAKRGRPVFTQMIRQLKRGRAAGLIMHKIDRSARNLRDWALVSELPNLGIDIFFATETLDFRSRGGRLAANLQAVIAEDYIHNLREETIKGLNGRLKQGLYPFRAPIGYLDNGRGEPKTPCPVKTPLIRKAFDLYASGQYSLRTLLPELERLGLRNLAGQPLSKHGLETILANPFYMGIIVIKRTGSVYDGLHAPIIDAKTFKRVQDVKAGRAGKKVTRHNHLYRGLFRCGLCDGPMSPERQKGRVYYRCQRPECPTTTVREDVIDATIIDILRRCQLSAEQAEQLRTEWQDWLDAAPGEDQLRSIELNIAQCQSRSDRLMDLLIDGTIDKAGYDKKKLAIEIDLAGLEAQREKLQTPGDLREKLGTFLELMQSLAELHIRAHADEKRRIVQNCFSNRTVVGRNLFLKPDSWLEMRDVSELSPLVTQHDPLLEFLQRFEEPPLVDGPNKPWRNNLKNQTPLDLRS
ncbi:recombinase family protein [Primorskyibacter aestuariivivens]|uniref:recombinase family protein n=1 Tax=Primorskyibacter aestuariivivens TaxID=1888912 RepID=UPI002301E459|nr:recombinase family protein [Primorskyibacter aestuariivivens]MDA7429968.1 recombinase family protein [Primorskyibacter aestuariivivens]